MDRRIVNPWKWQDQYGFVEANDISDVQRMVMCSEQVYVDDEENPGDMAAQFNQVFGNIDTVLEESDLSLADVVRLSYYTTDISAFMEAGPVLAKRLDKAGCRPASTLLGVAALFHPDIIVEIEATAAV